MQYGDSFSDRKEASGETSSARSISRQPETGLCKEWLGLRELTRYADISERTLRSWIYSRADPLPAAKVCGKVLVRNPTSIPISNGIRSSRCIQLTLTAS